MQEYSSISVSSYEAASLAGQLTEQSRDGWAVVTIVPTGNTITAYLCREAAEDESTSVVDDAATADGAEAAEPATADEPVPEPVSDATLEPVPSEPTPTATSDADDQPSLPTVAPQLADEPAPAAEPVAEAAAVDEPATADTPAAPVDEPAGWGASDTAAEPALEPADEPAPEPAAESTPEPAAEPAAAAAGAAPAGWYADPSSRFELRYWDGAQWTEHVSRAGQQYTDPPVA